MCDILVNVIKNVAELWHLSRDLNRGEWWTERPRSVMNIFLFMKEFNYLIIIKELTLDTILKNKVKCSTVWLISRISEIEI